MTTLFLYMAVYLLPAFLLSHLALDVLLRNPRQVEHRLLSLFVFGYAMLFLAEFGRHLSPIEASPAFVTYWFGNAGILIFVCSVHFIVKVTGVGDETAKMDVSVCDLFTARAGRVDVHPSREHLEQPTLRPSRRLDLP
ncbi:hypothetical protein [Exiguobacterium sp. TNDT2]|uniref:hypothetical protein n=1 Tax=Exiguobacterium sp. TNDT2 TaxID=2233531 RepID=UPI001E4F0FC9|nr:hypothetical protein [Exiguobacterium sp. TNDT2]